MKLLTFCIATLVLSTAKASINLKEVRCLVCRATVDEFTKEVSKIDPSQEIEVGQYRLDSKGNNIQKKIPLATSEVHLSEMLDTICKKMDDYVRATYKSTGQLTLFKLVADEGVNPLINEVDIVQDGDLNKSLEHFCTEIINDHEDDFIEVIKKKEKDAKTKICSEMTDYCSDFEFDENEDEDEDEDKDDDKDEL